MPGPSAEGVYLPLALADLWRERRSAVMRQEGPAGTREVFVVQGEIRAARSAVSGERLGEWLVRRGRLAEETLATALLHQVGREAPPLGRVLVERRVIDHGELERELEALSRSIVVAAAREYPARLTVEPHQRPLQPDTLRSVATRTLLLESARAVPAEQRAKLPGFSATGALVAAGAAAESEPDLALTPLERSLLAALETEKTLQSLARELKRDPGEIAAAAWPLLVARLVVPVERSQAPDRAELLRLAAKLERMDHYSILGLKIGATYQEVFDAWERAKARFDPGLAERPGFEDLRPVLEQLFSRAQEAAETLSNPAQRMIYDRIVKTATRGGGKSAAAPSARTNAKPREEERRRAREEIARASLERARHALAAGNLFEAHALLDQACRIDPRPEALVLLAQVQARNPRWASRCLESLRRAVELDAGFVPAWWELAEFWRRRGNAERERRALERVLAADPMHAQARRRYQDLTGTEALSRLLQRVGRKH